MKKDIWAKVGAVKTDFTEPWCLDVGCNEYGHGVGKMAEFFGRIIFLHKYGELFLALRMLMVDLVFLCL